MEYVYIFANTLSDGNAPYISGICAKSLEEAVKKYLLSYDEYPDEVIEQVLKNGIRHNKCYFEGNIEDFSFSTKRKDYFMVEMAQI